MTRINKNGLFYVIPVLTLIFSLFVYPSNSYALNCAEIKNPKEALEIYDAAVVGKVLHVKNDISQPGFTGPKEIYTYVLLQVEESWKKQFKSQIIFQSDFSWGFDYKEGQEYLVFLYEEDGFLINSPCSQTLSKHEGPKWFGEGFKPTSKGYLAPKMWVMFDKDMDLLLVATIPIIIILGFILYRRKNKQR